MLEEKEEHPILPGREEQGAVEVEEEEGSTSKKARYRASVVTRAMGYLAKESPALGTYVIGFLKLSSRVETAPFFAKIKERLLTIPRFRSVYRIQRKSAFYEIDHDDMDFDYHFQVAMDGQKPTLDEIVEFVTEKVQGEHLDETKPLWQFTVIPETADGRSILVTNISHIIGDGVSLLEVLCRLMDNSDDKTQEVNRPKPKRSKQKVGFLTRASIFAGGVFDGVFAVLGRPDPPSTLKLKGTMMISGEKRLLFTEKIELSRLKEIKQKIEGATLNDVFMVLLTMVLRYYYNETHEEPTMVRASFPMNLRKRGEDNFDRHGSPHNVFAYGIMKFNINYTDVVDLFRRVKKSVDRIKLSPSPYVQKRLGKIIHGMIPVISYKVVNQTAINLANKCTAVLSNVAGPSNKVRIADYEVEDLTFQLFTPNPLYLGLISYNGMLSCSINADRNIADPQKIAKHWIPAFEDLYKAIMDHEGIIRL